MFLLEAFSSKGEVIYLFVHVYLRLNLNSNFQLALALQLSSFGGASMKYEAVHSSPTTI